MLHEAGNIYYGDYVVDLITDASLFYPHSPKPDEIWDLYEKEGYITEREHADLVCMVDEYRL